MPRPYGYIPDLAGREAFVMERLEGETIGRRIVQKEELEHARFLLPVQMAEELAKIHAIPAARVSFLPEARLERMVEELDEVGEPHPAIELGLWWLREHRPPPRERVVVHGDYRIGNLVVDEAGLVGVLDWEFAHLDDPVRDLAFALVRAWRFGIPEKRLGGIGDVDQYLATYNELTGFDVQPYELDYWELAGNVGWAIGCLTQMQRHLTGQDRSIELATLGRLGAEVEYEIVPLAGESRRMTERPTAQELTEAILEFLGGEILPTLTDHRLRFRMLVAMNALGIVYRELAALPVEDDAEQRELVQMIRAGNVPPGTLRRVKAEVEARLRIASPGFLEKYRQNPEQIARGPGSRRSPARATRSRREALKRNALSPVSARPIRSFWIWLVPS